MTVANGMGTAIFPAHFYNALRQKQNGIAPWPIMEELIAIHGENRLFLGSKPTTIMDSYKQIVLTLGHSVADFSANLRKRKLRPSKNGPRGLKESSPLSEIFRQNWTVEGNVVIDKSALTLHRVEALLTEQALDEEIAGNPVSKRVRHKMAVSKQLSPLDLLDALMVSIPRELPKLQYDYFELHRQSIGVLRKVCAEMDEDFKRYIGEGYLENESQLPFLGPYEHGDKSPCVQAVEPRN
ncbi:uncharacterized protein LY89DRAFT_788748 [Mollisia scopiformis]|uniref:Uncharacterized protein n=1 Tax=Mollisia scopiformis TaxID=149040 RepID=A0A132B8X6_MOLSC|nr:uncharacterized protein LY89DRAFT_788748 [Mollisia scopiformis]KUJ08858.1 hypothetical protein LY89DRAFT_788748 [Mollisia scopiformis]